MMMYQSVRVLGTVLGTQIYRYGKLASDRLRQAGVGRVSSWSAGASKLNGFLKQRTRKRVLLSNSLWKTSTAFNTR
jgi:hypothetical protein